MKCPFCIKVCTKCKRLLVAYKGNFAKEKTGKYGFRSKCKECDNKSSKQYYEDNSEHIKKYKKQYYKDNSEYIKQHSKQWNKDNPEHKKEYMKQYYDKYLEENGLERGQGSIGEQKVRQVLRESNFTFSEQHRFDDCKFKYTLPFDFYIPSLNIAIEYDGIQHFNIVEAWGGIEHLVDNVIRDTIKNDYCRRNNIRLIRIPYWEFDNIETILSDLL